MARHILFKVTGTVNDSARISMTGATNGSDGGPIHFNLVKGNNSFSDRPELYSENYRIIYLHRKATKGQLKIRLQLLSADGDTLTENQ